MFLLKKISLILIIVALTLAVFFIVKRDKVEIINKNKNKSEVDLTLLEKIYKSEVKVIIANYLRLAQNGINEAEQARQAKNQLLDLKVPTKFKELHLNLALALTKAEDAINENNEAKLRESQEMINNEKMKYEWLN